MRMYVFLAYICIINHILWAQCRLSPTLLPYHFRVRVCECVCGLFKGQVWDGRHVHNCCHLFIAQKIKLITIFDTERHRPLHCNFSNGFHEFRMLLLWSAVCCSFFPFKGPKFRNVKIFELKFMRSHSQRLSNFISFISLTAGRPKNKNKKPLGCRQSLKIMFMIIIMAYICTTIYIY